MDRFDVERHWSGKSLEFPESLWLGQSEIPAPWGELAVKSRVGEEKRSPMPADSRVWQKNTHVVQITHRHVWVPGKLLSFRVTRPASFRFCAGQFARLGMIGDDDKPIFRALSIVSAEYDEFLEFYVVLVPDGAFSQQLSALDVGSTLLLDRRAFGYLTLDRFQDGDQLWMLASGTGIAPYLSILSNPETWRRFGDIVLIYSVRKREELAYQAWLASLMSHPLVGEFAYRLRYVPVVTGDDAPGCYLQRITRGITDGSLEKHVGLALDVERSRIMICGNPDMVRDMRTVLSERGFSLARSNVPGQIALELYW